MKIALSIPGTNGAPVKIDSGLPDGVPTGGLFDKGGNVIDTFIILVIILAVLVSLWYVLKGGWDIITSQGEKEKIHEGRSRVLWAILGLIFILLSFFMINVANVFFGTNLIPFASFFNPR